MKKILPLLAFIILNNVHANDSTGYVGIGGVDYIKNDNIAMQTENLYISKNTVKVDYEFKNLTDKPITETILFPLPIVPTWVDGGFADMGKTLRTFHITANGKPVNYQTHVRVFGYPTKDGETDIHNPIDITTEFYQCGVSTNELLQVWDNMDTLGAINQKLGKCNNPTLTKLIGEFNPDTDSNTDPNIDPAQALAWDAQVIYEFKQTFAPSAITKISHSYTPLVGGGVQFIGDEIPEASQNAQYCVDKNLQNTLQRYEAKPYSAVSYILTTGANWAKSIDRFTLTIERDKDELVSFCWRQGTGKVQKVGNGKFSVTETNFKPTQDLDIAFIAPK